MVFQNKQQIWQKYYPILPYPEKRLYLIGKKNLLIHICQVIALIYLVYSFLRFFYWKVNVQRKTFDVTYYFDSPPSFFVGNEKIFQKYCFVWTKDCLIVHTSITNIMFLLVKQICQLSKTKKREGLQQFVFLFLLVFGWL